MTVRAIDNVGVAVRDVKVVADFFADRLGLDVTRYPDSDPPAATAQLENGYLYLFQTTGTGGAARRPELTTNPPGVDHVSFGVADVDALYRELGSRGVPFEGEPESVTEWGIRMVAFTDPEENLYFLVQPIA